jgi:hypothetical protein
MSERNQIGTTCQQVREHLPDFLAGTMPEREGHLMGEHLADCAECSDLLALEPELRQRLDQGVVLEAAPAGLAERIRLGIDKESKANSGTRWRMALAAAAVLFVLLNVASYTVKGTLPHEFAIAELRIRASLEKVHEMLGVGLGDHLICTVYRRLAEEPPSEESITSEMGADWAPLADVATNYAPDGFDVRLAHRCNYRGREFVHLSMYDGEQVMSLILTQRRKDDAFSSSDIDPGIQLATLDVYGVSFDEFGVSAFETDDFLVYLVSDLTAADHAAAATAYFPAISVFLATATPITAVD